MAAYLTSRFVTRPDLRDKYLPEFINYSFEVCSYLININYLTFIIVHKIFQFYITKTFLNSLYFVNVIQIINAMIIFRF